MLYKNNVKKCSKLIANSVYFFLQSWTKHLETFSLFSHLETFFTTSETELDYYHPKVNVQASSRVADVPTQEKKKKDLGSYPPSIFAAGGGAFVPTQERKRLRIFSKLGNLKKIPEILGFDGKYPAVHPKAKF